MKYRTELPSVEQLQNLFTYENGKLFWKVKPNRNIVIGNEAGCIKSDGYVDIKINGKHYKAHRLIWKMLKGEEPPKYIDHINQNKLDNNIENLREVTSSQNSLNNKAKGCCFHKTSGKWVAYIGINKKIIYLGIFNTEAEATAVYKNYKTVYTGEAF